MNRCALIGNSAFYDGGGADGGTLNNCLVVRNSAIHAGGGLAFGNLANCTVAGNLASDGGGTYSSTLFNCIAYFNTATTGANFSSGYIFYSCTTPAPPTGFLNIALDPLFVDAADDNFRLQDSSPCINAGSNPYAYGTLDLDGRARFTGNSVDMGAYEIQPGVSGVFINWLQKNGLATDGSDDHTDSDGDGADNWYEWHSDTIPNDPLSVFRLKVPTYSPPGLKITWLSVPTRTYFVQRAINLSGVPDFVTVATNIIGNTNFTTYTDTGAPAATQIFYKVGIQ